ncbi:putative cyclin-dependent serine/threonine-protein kinase DDB_G0272797/DDB_G0274007 [Drosophila ficusphila]|uniref:putative cyclin-dependent serine/threonine-protein kinase DDB_G0272797/DDB_G0274007 n=1 Tax=Drosophila ficusphila TaxID=30025 RepID=UPI001C8A3A78|nr:putative cyclin-dependent serine/threonine-protein kinase DDB_G0272797/DDB_G0274007 [Drosophila ficusphila]
MTTDLQRAAFEADERGSGSGSGRSYGGMAANNHQQQQQQQHQIQHQNQQQQEERHRQRNHNHNHNQFAQGQSHRQPYPAATSPSNPFSSGIPPSSSSWRFHGQDLVASIRGHYPLQWMMAVKRGKEGVVGDLSRCHALVLLSAV